MNTAAAAFPSVLFESIAAPLIVMLVAGFVALWFKNQNTLAVLEDRSTRDDRNGSSADAGQDEAVAELRRQNRSHEDRIADLERALDRERDERAEDNRRAAREIAELNRQIQELLRAHRSGTAPPGP